MYKSITVLLFIFVILSCRTTKKTTTEDVADSSFLFPVDWIGEYDGTLTIHSLNNDTTNIRMRLYIDYPDAEGYYPWTLVYGETDVRKYGVEAINPQRGHYMMDEYNSILLDCYQMANNFISRFKVGDTNLLVDYERVPEGIIVQFYVSKAESHSTTGGEVIKNDTIPLVDSYPMAAYQKAFLKKKE